jgi:DNA invertase Pin-like site-specific DNA recombinase
VTRIAIYSRIGNERSKDTEHQLAEMRRQVLSKYPSVDLFVDREDKISHFPELRRLFQSAARREFDVVLVWALDRIMSESVDEVFEHIRKLRRCGIQFVSYTEEHFRSGGPAGALMIQIPDWIAQQQSILISERTKVTLAMARAAGKPLGRPRKAVPLADAAADRGSGMSWRQLEQKYGIPQSTLRNAIRSRTEAGLPMPLEPSDAPDPGTQEELQ